MANVARKSGTDTVSCTDGTQGTQCSTNPPMWNWNTPTVEATDAGSSKVFSQGVGVVRQGDAMQSHPDGVPCTPSPINHAPTLSTYSSKVFVEGKGIGRVGDKYDSDGHYSHAISSGSPKVFAG